jgi:hypothetical protein
MAFLMLPMTSHTYVKAVFLLASLALHSVLAAVGLALTYTEHDSNYPAVDDKVGPGCKLSSIQSHAQHNLVTMLGLPQAPLSTVFAVQQQHLHSRPRCCRLHGWWQMAVNGNPATCAVSGRLLFRQSRLTRGMYLR